MGKVKDSVYDDWVSFVFFSDLPFSLVGFNLGYYMVIIATILSVYSGIQYFMANKKYLKQ